MPETASLETHEALPPPAARRDVRVVTPEQLLELRREQQEIYLSLRSSGSGPSDAARQIGIPRSLADEWERSAAAAPGGSPAPAAPKDGPAPVAPPATARDVTSPTSAPSDTSGNPLPARTAEEAGNPPPATTPDGLGNPLPATTAGEPGGRPTPRAWAARARPRPAEAARVVFLDEDIAALARQARERAQQLQRELTALKRLVKRLEAATAAARVPAGPTDSAGPGSQPGTRVNGASPQGTTTAGVPPRAARSSLTTLLLARGRARQHPTPSSRS